MIEDDDSNDPVMTDSWLVLGPLIKGRGVAKMVAWF